MTGKYMVEASLMAPGKYVVVDGSHIVQGDAFDSFQEAFDCMSELHERDADLIWRDEQLQDVTSESYDKVERLWNDKPFQDAMQTHVGKQAPETRQAITQACDSLRDLLLEKNRRYGDSALKPVGVFTAHTDGGPLAGLYARLDDKLSRIANADTVRKNDVADLVGYLILVCVKQGWLSFDDLID